MGADVNPLEITPDEMAEAVRLASSYATSGDVVLLSPACASFDWYPGGGYPARGDDFKRLVTALAEKEHA